MNSTFETMLTGGHPNSLGRTLEVVDAVLADRSRLPDLVACYRSDDEVVRLRTSNAVKRVTIEYPEWTAEHVEDLLGWIADIDQPSTQWTLALLFDMLRDRMDEDQRERALAIVKRNLAGHDDWIVLNNSMKTLTKWTTDTPGLADWMRPHLERLTGDRRKSVVAQARRSLKAIG